MKEQSQVVQASHASEIDRLRQDLASIQALEEARTAKYETLKDDLLVCRTRTKDLQLENAKYWEHIVVKAHILLNSSLH